MYILNQTLAEPGASVAPCISLHLIHLDPARVLRAVDMLLASEVYIVYASRRTHIKSIRRDIGRL